MATKAPLSQAGEQPSDRRRLFLVLGASALLLIGGLAGFGLGRHPTTRVSTGLLHSSGYQADVEAGGWTYNVPFDVQSWSYQSSSIPHAGSVPPCVRRPGDREVTFGWVPASEGGASWRQVVWVACPG